MWRVMQVVALAAVAAMPVAAQQGQGGGGRGMMRGITMEELAARVKLEESQKPGIQVLLDKYTTDTKVARETMQANMQAVRNGETTMEAVQGENQAAMLVMREKMDSLTKDIRACLTPEQQKEFDAYLAERAQRMQGGRRPPS